MSLPHEGDAAEIYCATTEAFNAGASTFTAFVENLLGTDDVTNTVLTAVADRLAEQEVVAAVTAHLAEVA